MDDSKANIEVTIRKLQSVQETDKTFSLTSEIKLNAAEWESGTKFTCKATHNSTQYVRTISVCDVYENVPPSIHVEIPSLETVMKAAFEVQATCLVHTAFKANVTWLINGSIDQGSKVNLSRSATDLTSTLTLPSSHWNQLKLLTCKAEHKCFSAIEKNISLAEPSATAPLVEIRRSLLDLQKGNSSVLQCDVTQLSSTDIFITFQANGVNMSEGQYVKLPKAPGLHSVSRRFTVPSSHWNKDAYFTCKVNQGFNRITESKSIGKFIADPSVELLLVPSKTTEDQKLLCLGRGFDPKILWMPESQTRSSSSKDISIDAQGHVTVTSQLHIPQTEWETGKVFTCEILDKSSNISISKNISICSVFSTIPPSIHVEIPSLETVMKAASEVQATCLVHTAFKANVTWLINGSIDQGSKVNLSRSATDLTSTLTLPSSHWNLLKLLTCKAEHKCFSAIEKNISLAEPSATAPLVEIRRSLLDLQKGNSSVLQCDVTQLSSTDIFITFQANGVNMSEGQYVKLPKAPGLHSVSRRFTVPSSHWNKDAYFTCKVNQGFNRITESKSIGKFIADPSVELLLVPSKTTEDQKLLCLGRGFDPKILWMPKSQTRSSSSQDISIDAQGHVTVTSQLHIPQTEWETGKVFTCEILDKSSNISISKNISICSVFSTIPPSIHVEIPSLETVMKAASEVQATCLVHTAFKANVTWLINGSIDQGSKVNLSRSATDLTSTLTLPSSHWNLLKLLTCKAEHKCFSAIEKNISLAEPSATAPLVEIRRSLLDLQKGNSSVLQCDVTQLSSTDIFITFQANGVNMSEGQYVKLPKAPGLHSVSRRFTVPSSHWNKDAYFTCKVNQGFNRITESKSIGKFIADPSVELLLVPSKTTEDQKLLCLGRGFDPEILWMPESQTRSSSKDISIDAQGHVTVTSQLYIPQTEWETGKVFTCEILDKSSNISISKNISISSASPQTVGIHVQGPPLTQLEQQKQVTLSCLLIDGEIKSAGSTKEPIVEHSNETETLRCFLNISAEDWLAHKQVHCVAKHPCYNQSYEGHAGNSKELSPPTVRIFKPTSSDLSTSDVLTLLCLVSGFSPSHLMLHWEKNGHKLNPIYYTTSVPWKYEGSSTYSLSSRLSISKPEDRGSLYSCVVAHEFSEDPFKSPYKDIWVTYAAPSATLLDGTGELVCLVSGFSPALINITWFLDNTTQLLGFKTTEPHRGPDGRFSVQSHLHLPHVKILNGTVTCVVEHFNTTIALNITGREFSRNSHLFDKLNKDGSDPDMDVGTWYMAFTFLLFFLFAIIYSVFATIIKTSG